MDLAHAHLPRTEQVRVFVCDDVAGYRNFLRSALEIETGISVVGEAADARSCLTRIATSRPDVVLLDISMPVDGDAGDGLWAIPRIRATIPECAIVVLSSLSAEKLRPAAMAAGASEYIEKGASIACIADAVRSAATAE